MKNVVFGGVALALAPFVAGGGALAADLKARAIDKAPPPVEVRGWTGCYVGGHVGSLRLKTGWVDTDSRDIFGHLGESDGGHTADGVLGGVQGGCDYQFAGRFVIGVAGDTAWSDADGQHPSPLYPGYTLHTGVTSLASVTGRIGYAWGDVLGYVKGGAAWERQDHFYVFGPLYGSASPTRSGWTVGIGGEYRFTTVLSGFAEYDYYDFGARDVWFADNVAEGGFHYTYGIKATQSVFKVGVNLRWDGGAAAGRY
jgi:outer membrane immunogenic protein